MSFRQIADRLLNSPSVRAHVRLPMPLPPLSIPPAPLKPYRLADLDVVPCTRMNEIELRSEPLEDGVAQAMIITEVGLSDRIALMTEQFDDGREPVVALVFNETPVALDYNARKALRVLLARLDGEDA